MPSNRVDGPSSNDFMDEMIKAARQGKRSTGIKVLSAVAVLYGAKKVFKRGKRK
jgi:hypothetical protein